LLVASYKDAEYNKEGTFAVGTVSADPKKLIAAEEVTEYKEYGCVELLFGHAQLPELKYK
jgi:hypothetical protein